MEKILISACLVGDNCKYDGKNNEQEWIEHLSQYYDLVPFCPEVEGGLPTPRIPSEIKSGQVRNKEGKDVSLFFNLGAERALNVCRHAGIRLAILKENSPSCGVYSIYDGSFKGKLVKGEGITANLLKHYGIKVISENEVESLLENLDLQKKLQLEGRERNIALDKEKIKKEKEEQDKKEERKKFTSKKPFHQNRNFKSSDKKSFSFNKNHNFKNDTKGNNRKKSFKKDGFKNEQSFSKKPFKSRSKSKN